MQGNKLIIFILSLLILLGCKPKELKPKEYIQYAKSSLIKEREIGDFKFELFFQPIDYKLAQDWLKENGKNIDIKKIKQEIAGMQYYTLKISPIKGNESILKYNLQSEEDYQARLAYFSFGMQKDLYVETKTEKIPCDLYHFERAYDLSNFRVFDLAFKEQEVSQEDRIVVLHSDFFGTGPIKFKFKARELDKLPKLKLE